MACRAACASMMACRFYSITAQGVCTTCIACDYADRELNSEPEPSLARSVRPIQSFVKSSSTALQERRVVTGRVLNDLQGAYSVALYGAEGRAPDISKLRIVWMPLLSNATLLALAQVGLCHKAARPPLHPFYWSHSRINHNPRNAVWIRPIVADRPAANHTWLEVTHCAWKHDPHIHRTDGDAGPMFLYAATGSGVSINTGRTLVFGQVSKAQQALRRAHLLGPCAPTPPECTPNSHRQPKVERVGNVSQQDVGSRVGRHVGRHVVGRRLSKRTSRTCAARSTELDQYDTLQVVGNRDYYKGEARHEVIWTHRSECDELRASDPAVWCGRHPHLNRCTAKSPGLHAMRRCGIYYNPSFKKRGFTGTNSHFLPGQPNGNPFTSNDRGDKSCLRSKCSSSCFSSPHSKAVGREGLGRGSDWSRDKYMCASMRRG